MGFAKVCGKKEKPSRFRRRVSHYSPKKVRIKAMLIFRSSFNRNDFAD